jgi:hypothetical protein
MAARCFNTDDGRDTVYQHTVIRRPAMTTQHRTSDADSTPAIACTLTSADLAAQGGRWERLAAWAMTERAETVDGLRIVFRPEAGAEEELRALVAVENECCSWADWAVEADDVQIVLHVRATPEGAAVLHGMFAGLQPPRP